MGTSTWSSNGRHREKFTTEPEEYFPYDLVEILRRENPDLVHVYYGHKAVKYHAMLTAWGGPWIVSFHGVDVVKFFDREGYHDQMRRVFRDAQLVLGRSESLLEKLEDLGCPREKLRLNRTPIPMMSAPQPLPRTPPGEGDGHWRLLQACRLVEKKGILTTLRALSEVVKTIPNFRYILCGNGPFRDMIVSEVGRLGLGDNVQLRGWLSQAALAEEFEKAAYFSPPERTDRIFRPGGGS